MNQWRRRTPEGILPECVHLATTCLAAHTLRLSTSSNPRLISAFCYGCSHAISLAEATQEENMTQLNLSDRHSTTAQGSSSVKENGRSISNQMVGALGALLMLAVVIGIGSCSRGNSKPAVVAQTTHPAAPIPNPVPQATPTPAPKPMQAKSRKRRAATLSYVNREYGISFSFPRQYRLTSGDEAQLSWGGDGFQVRVCQCQREFAHDVRSMYAVRVSGAERRSCAVIKRCSCESKNRRP